MEETTRAGHVALIGLPNAGKSSLLNRFLGSKLSIVTPFAQTTRERVVGIDTGARDQLIFLDTPGIVDPAYLLHHAMAEIVEDAIRDADVVVLLVDGTRAAPALADEVIASLRALGRRLLVAINKIDVADRRRAGELEHWVRETLGSTAHRISAETGVGVEDLRSAIVGLLPESPFFYPEEDISTQSVRFFVAELIRETVFELYKEEIPYSVATKIDEFREESDPIVIRATIYVERDSQKAIIIGQKGAAIRELGIRARAKIESFVEEHVFLELWVKVLPKWRKNALELRRLGFSLPQTTDR
jgi:GTPase